MPIYEYACDKCKVVKEITHGISEKKSPKCPKCGKVMKRIMSLGSFQLKGTGWYKTDYPKSGSAGTGKKSDAKGESKGEAKTETKAETKSESKKEKAISASSES
ncbi:MAG: zinc ribbon domain-containing protein [Nitrospinae bacterium]|nr:zinc ribbon domain-containing protein [Nitrospinota bacterium]